MKKISIALIALTSLFSCNIWAAVPPPSSPIIGIDSNHDLILDEKSVATGADSFLARLAKPDEITTKAPGLFKGDDNKFYMTISIGELKKMDIDKNQFIDSNELADRNLIIAQHSPKDPKIIHIFKARNEKIVGIHLPSPGSNKIIVLWQSGKEDSGKAIAVV